MNPVINTLREHITDKTVSFVFPSQIASSLWAQKTCTLGLARSVAKRRFLAWDRFKEDVVREKGGERQLRDLSPASSVMRKLFAEALLRKNAEKPFLKSIVPVEYAKGGSVFVLFAAKLLPSLASWEKIMANTGLQQDDEDDDYRLVKKEYAAFLERFSLFEPSWEEMKTQASGKRYAIFFPELIEDFAEYDELLSGAEFIRISAKNVTQSSDFLFFQSAREEIRCTVLELQRLHEEEGVPYEDMAVSIPELEEIEPNLSKELSLRHIPFARRAGKKLGSTGAGRLFSLAGECAASRFSFNSLKALILNDHIPWREREKNKALINFGIKYNCVLSYSQDGKSVDIWEEAFKETKSEAADLQPYYKKIKQAVLALNSAGSFRDIKNKYFEFWNPAYKNGLLDMEKISASDDAILSRCIAELGSLIDLEERFNESALVPASPLRFFISCLDETMYVSREEKTGVNIYPWRAAAASPFTCHFVLNASQSAASVLYQPLKFLRHDKRKRLGITDKDATGDFFTLYNTGENGNYKSRCQISVSAQSFSGWAIPHSFFAQSKNVNTSVPKPTSDPYREERLFWKEVQKNTAAAKLQKIYPMQKNAFNLWKDTLVQNENAFSFFYSAMPEVNPVKELLKNAILKDGFLAVTPTRDLNEFFKCPLLWLLSRIFTAAEFSLEASLLDDTSLGLLYHKILEKLFYKIKNEDRCFNSGRLETYKHWALEITEAVIKQESAFKGPLAVPLVSPQAAGMAKKIGRLLELEAASFDNYAVAELELRVSLKTDKLCINGVIDRVSVSPEGEPVIIDYKTSILPEQTSLENLPGDGLKEFQMPLYIKLYEELLNAKANAKVEGAFFYSINGRKIKTVLGKNTGGKSKAPAREEYEPFLKAAENQIEEFCEKVKGQNFIPAKIRIKECSGCVYNTVCRVAYFLNSARL